MAKKKVQNLTYEQRKKLLLKPCKTKAEFKKWIKFHLDIHLPDCTVSRYADTNPFNAIWEIYQIAVLNKNPEMINELLLVAGRGSGKTLGMAIVEMMIVLHDQRDIVHVGAVMAQATRCYDYIKNFLYNRRLKTLVTPSNLAEDKRILNKANMSKSLFNVNGQTVSLEVLPCTLKACVDPQSIVKTKRGGYHSIDSVRIGDYIASWDYMRGEFPQSTYRKVIDKWTKYSDTYKITLEDGLESTGGYDNKILTRFGWQRLCDINYNTKIVRAPQFKKNSSKTKYRWNKPNFNQQQWRSALIGMMLGDAHLSIKIKDRKQIGNARLYKGHSIKQHEYFNYCREIIEQHIKVNQIRDKKSGYGSNIKELITESTEELQFLVELFTDQRINKKIITDQLVDYIDEIALAFWIQDDGIAGQQLELSTCSLTDKECNKLLNMFHSKFNLKSAHVRNSHKYNVIRFNSSDTRTMRDIVQRYVHPTMYYKISTDIVPEKLYSFDMGDEIDISKTGCSVLLKEVTDGQFSNKQWKQWFRKWSKDSLSVVNIEFLGKQRLIDIEVEGNNRSDHSFLVNGINSLQCNGPHVPMVVVDEIDTVSGEGVKAFGEISGMLDSKGTKHALRVGISTRKSRYGLMNQQMENADTEGRTVRKWTAWEFSERCPDDRSGTDETDLWVLQEDFIVLTEEEYKLKSKQKQKEFMRYTFPGSKCRKCPAAAICLGDAKKQTSKSPMLKPIQDIMNKVRKGPDWALAQLMNLKPSVEGIIYREFDERVHVNTWNEMWKKLTGVEYPGECTHDIFVKKCHQLKLPCYAGIDWGWSAPSTVVYFFLDKRENVYAVRADGMCYVSDPTWANYVKTKYHHAYKCQLYFPDAAVPGSMEEMKKIGLPVANYVKPEIMTGVQIIKRLLRVPGTEDTKFHVAKETCQSLIEEFSLYHFKLNTAGEVTDQPEDAFNHWLDAIRYPLNMLLGHSTMLTALAAESDHRVGVYANNQFYRTPSAGEFAESMGIPFSEEVDTSKVGKIGTANELDSEEDEEDEIGGDGGFLWSV